MIKKLKTFFEQQEPMYQIDRPEESPVFLQARHVMGMYIQEQINKNGGLTDHNGFLWIRNELTSPSFDDMNFKYKNKIFSLLLELKYEGRNILPEARKEIFERECKNNNLTPCLFPVDIETLSPIGTNWNLYHLNTNELIDPLQIASDEKVIMSEWELNQFAISLTLQQIKHDGLKVHSFCDAPGIEPQIWFQSKEGHPSWILVKYTLAPENPKDVLFDNVERIALNLQKYDGYTALIKLESEDGLPYRGSKFFVNFDDLKQVYWAKHPL